MNSACNKALWTSVVLASLASIAGCAIASSEGDAPTGDETTQKGSSELIWGSVYGQFRAVVGSRCLDIPGGSTVNRTAVQIYDCNGGSNQKWSFWNPNGALINTSGKVLDAPFTWDQSTTWIFDYTGGADQAWTMPSVEILGEGKCLDVPFESDGSVVWIFSCLNSANQKWTFDDNTSQIHTSTGRCLTMTSQAAGSPVVATRCNGASNQRWTAGPRGSIRQGNTCLDIRGGSTSDRTPLQAYPCNSGAAQSFSFRGSLRGTQSGKCLQLPTAGSVTMTGDHTLPQLFTCNGRAEQLWQFEW